MYLSERELTGLRFLLQFIRANPVLKHLLSSPNEFEAPLNLAIEHVEALQLLIDTDLIAASALFKALCLACEHDNEEGIKVLVNKHPSLLHDEFPGLDLPLHIVCRTGKVEILKILVEAG